MTPPIRPTRVERVLGPAQPAPGFVPGPNNVISVAFRTALMKPGSANEMVAYYSALLFLQTCYYTGSQFVSHDLSYGTAEALTQRSEIQNAFDKAGLAPYFMHSHWTRPINFKESYADFEGRWKDEHPDTQNMVVVDDGTFASVPDFAGHKNLVLATSDRGFQLYHARRVIEAMGGNWDEFRAMRNAQLDTLLADKKNIHVLFKSKPGELAWK